MGEKTTLQRGEQSSSFPPLLKNVAAISSFILQGEIWMKLPDTE